MENTENMTQVESAVEQTMEVVVTSEKTRKHPAALGKLNRMTAKAMAKIEVLGHEAKRFKRDYATGEAIYSCANCQATAKVTAVAGRGKSAMEGDALVSPCTKALF